MVVEPSGFATDWAGSSMTIHDIPADYDATIGVMQPARCAPTRPAPPATRSARPRSSSRSSSATTRPSHLLLGVNAVEMALDYSRRQLAEASAWEKVSRSADYAEPYPPSSRPTSRPGPIRTDKDR